MPSARGQRVGDRRARARSVPSTAAPAPRSTLGVAAGRHGHQRVQRERLAAAEDLEAGGAGAVAEQRAGRASCARPRRSCRPGTVSRTTSASVRDRLAAPERGRVESAAASTVPRRPAPTTAQAGRFVGALRVQFSHRDTGSHPSYPGECGDDAGSAVRGGILAPCPALRSGARSSRPSGSRPRPACAARSWPRTPHDGRLRLGQRRRRPDVRRRGARAPTRTSRASRSSARRAGCWTRCWARSASPAATCSCANVLKCRPPGQPRPAAAGDRRLPGLPVPAARADRAEGRLHARELRDQAAARRHDRDHAAARPRRGAADRPAAACGCTRSSTPPRRSTRRRCWRRCARTSGGFPELLALPAPEQPEPEPELVSRSPSSSRSPSP